jgi:hypothetical protein
MPIFAPTSTAGYSDPLKALNIKALEARQKQQAAMPTDAITPENTQTPMQGAAHVLSQLGDSMAQQRTIQALSERQARFQQALAHTDWNKGVTSENISEFSADPEFLKAVVEKEYLRRQTAAEQQGLNTRDAADNANRVTTTGMTQAGANYRTETETKAHSADNAATIAGRSADNAATIKGHHEDVVYEQDAATGRETARLGSQEKEGGLNRAQQKEIQTGTQTHEASQLRLKAAIDAEAAKLLYAQQNHLQAEEAASKERLVQLTAELGGVQKDKDFEHDKALLDQKYANDDKLAAKAQDARRTEIAMHTAAAAGQADKAAELKEKLLRIQGDIEVGKQDIKQKFEGEQKQKQIDADAARTAADNAAKLDAERLKIQGQNNSPQNVKAKRDLEHDFTKRDTLYTELEGAGKALASGDVYSGFGAEAKTAIGRATGGLIFDQDLANRTRVFDNSMNKVAIMEMSDTLKGSSTEKEMTSFKEIFNDKSVPIEAKRDAFKRVIAAAKRDRDIDERAVRATGGDTSSATRPEEPAAVPRPDKDDAALLDEARGAIASGKIPRAAIEQQLQQWNVKGKL